MSSNVRCFVTSIGTDSDDTLEAAIAEIVEAIPTDKKKAETVTGDVEAATTDKKQAAVAFTVDFGAQETNAKVPKRIAERLQADKRPYGEV